MKNMRHKKPHAVYKSAETMKYNYKSKIMIFLQLYNYAIFKLTKEDPLAENFHF